MGIVQRRTCITGSHEHQKNRGSLEYKAAHLSSRDICPFRTSTNCAARTRGTLSKINFQDKIIYRACRSARRDGDIE